MEGPPPHGAKFPGMFMFTSLFWHKASETHELVTWPKNGEIGNEITFLALLAPQKDPVFFKRMDIVIFQSFPMWRNWGIVQLKANHFFEWTFQVPGCISAGWLMHLVMFCLTLWGDWLRGYLQCAGAYCHWPWEEGRFLRQKLYYFLFPQVG